MFAQQVPERFVGQFLKIHRAVAGEQIERLPGLIIELHALAGHHDRSGWQRSISGRRLAPAGA
jgi:hypothetical protein